MQQLKSILTSLKIGIFIIDPETCRILDTNEWGAELTGLAPDKIAGQPSRWFFAPPPGEKTAETGPGEMTQNREGLLTNHEGTVVPVLINDQTIEFQGRICYLRSVADISPLNKKVAELRRSEEELKNTKEHFQEIFNRMSDGVSVYEAVDGGNDFAFVDINKAAEKINRIKKEELLGRRVTEVFPGVEDFGLLNLLREVWKDGKPRFMEASLYQDERIRGYRENFIYRVSSGYVISIHSDVTERFLYERKLKQSRERYELAVKGSTDGIWDWDLVTGELYLSPQWKEQLGYADHELPNRFESFRERIHPDDRERVMERVQQYLSGNTDIYREEFRMQHRNGSHRWILARGKALRNEEGKPFRMAGSHSDVTQHREDLIEIEKARKAAERANEAKSLFLANMSHEIRTPMNAILGFAEILKSQLHDPSVRHYAESIETSGKTLLRLINDILDLSKIEAGKLDLQPRPTDPGKLFRDMETLFRIKTEEKGLVFQTEIDPHLPRALLLDETRLRQVLLNLISNAVKFTSRGTVILSANQKVNTGDPSQVDLECSVQDTGIGIPDDQVELIFDDFSQVSGQDGPHFGGTGLGLAITRRLVQMMNGHISLKSNTDPGKGPTGTTFTVILKNIPVSSVPDPQEGGNDEAGNLEFEPATLLVVDDMVVNRTLIGGYLQGQPVKVLEANDGKEATELAIIHHPQLILMDLKMPEMDGYEATRLLKSQTETSGIPVVALTASVFDDEEEKIRAHQFDGFLRKPVSRARLFKELSLYLPAERREKEDPESTHGIATDETTVPENTRPLPDELMDILESEYLPRLEEVRSSLIMGRIEDFITDLRNFNRDHAGHALIDGWCREAGEKTMAFDMERLPSILERFHEVIDSIKQAKSA